MKQLVEFNINDYVLIKVTPAGQQRAPIFATPDADGFIRMQMWQVMQDFGDLIFLGCDPPFETTIRIELPADRKPLPMTARDGLIALSRFQDLDDGDLDS